MENQLLKYLNKELKGIITSLTVYQGQSKDSGQPYYAILLKFINGYEKRLFLKSDESFAWTNAMEQLETQAQINANF